jgi:branched-chain amino acid transport system permease protein
MPQVDYLYSFSKSGISIVKVNMKQIYWADRLPQVWDEMRKKIRDITPMFPPGVNKPDIVDDFSFVFGFVLAVTGDGYTYAELEDYAKGIRKELNLVPGVARADLWGVQPKVIYLDISETQLAELKITAEDIIATLAAQVIFEFIFVHWESMTGGIRGINLPSPVVFGVTLDNEFKFYFVTLPVVIIVVAAARNIFRTRVGRAFIAIRDRDISAELMGINLFRYKMYAFGISSFIAGIAGCLWVNFLRTVTPEHFPLLESVRYLAMIIVGGLGSILGAIYGAIFMTLVPEFLKNTLGLLAHQFPKAMSYLFPMQEVVFGLLIVVFLVLEPHGLAEIWRRVKDYFRLWPFEH